jgi:DNA processing protein
VPRRSKISGRYVRPDDSAIFSTRLEELAGPGRPVTTHQSVRLGGDSSGGPILFCAGDATLLERPAVAIVGSREASAEGVARAKRLSRELVKAGVVVVSGLAAGIDTAAHTAAIENGGATVAVLGTPLDRCSPVGNARLQETIYRSHLLVSPFELGARVFPSNFPARNKIMAALTDGTCIIEAGETSGTLHQAAECVRLGRKLFFTKSLVESEGVPNWVKSFLASEEAQVLTQTAQLIAAIS